MSSASVDAQESASSASAAPTAPGASASVAADQPVVEVSGVKNPELKPYRQMLKGLDAFDKHHALAPSAPLKFKLVSDNNSVALDTVTLAISGDHTQIPLALDANGSFTLPRVASAFEDNADLMTNKKKKQLSWHADIHSPGVPDNVRRLGDLRLECEISYAVMREDMSFFVRNGLGMLGGLCRSTHVILNYLAPRALASATLVSGERRLPLVLGEKNPRIFQPVLSDDSWDDNSLVVYEFREAEKPKGEVNINLK